MIGVDTIFFRWGFTMGDWRTLGFLALATLLLRALLARSIEVGGGTIVSRSISWGEFVVLVLPPKPRRVSFCACKAGDVRGLKYAPGTVNCVSTGKWASKGVTAGDTSGVKAI